MLAKLSEEGRSVSSTNARTISVNGRIELFHRRGKDIWLECRFDLESLVRVDTDNPHMLAGALEVLPRSFKHAETGTPCRMKNDVDTLGIHTRGRGSGEIVSDEGPIRDGQVRSDDLNCWIDRVCALFEASAELLDWRDLPPAHKADTSTHRRRCGRGTSQKTCFLLIKEDRHVRCVRVDRGPDRVRIFTRHSSYR